MTRRSSGRYQWGEQRGLVHEVQCSSLNREKQGTARADADCNSIRESLGIHRMGEIHKKCDIHLIIFKFFAEIPDSFVMRCNRQHTCWLCTEWTRKELNFNRVEIYGQTHWAHWPQAAQFPHSCTSEWKSSGNQVKICKSRQKNDWFDAHCNRVLSTHHLGIFSTTKNLTPNSNSSIGWMFSLDD